MERKGTAVVTAEQVERGLERGVASAPEERALRMRYGARVDPSAPLPQLAEPDSELADELLVLEMRLLSALKERAASARGARGATAAKAPSAAKAKILAGLKKKR